MIAQREDLLKDRVAIEMKRYFRRNFKRIGHAVRVARYAEGLGKALEGDMAVILSAAYLHDIGIKESERKYNSTEARHQEEEGPQIAREMLKGLGARNELIEEVCDIIGHHHHPRAEESVNFMAVCDADLIANMEEDPSDIERLIPIIEKSFLNETGKDLALKVLAKREGLEISQKGQ